jgi:hypothetical protein
MNLWKLDRMIKHMSKLKLLPYYHDNYNNIVKDAIKSENFAYNNWWYIHGILEDLLGYDKADVINAKECSEFIRKFPKVDSLRYNGKIWIGGTDNITFEPHLYINDIIECEVIGIDELCIGYFWTVDESPLRVTSKSKDVFNGDYWRQGGLVCLKSDIEGCRHALRMYTEKTKIL